MPAARSRSQRRGTHFSWPSPGRNRAAPSSPWISTSTPTSPSPSSPAPTQAARPWRSRPSASWRSWPRPAATCPSRKGAASPSSRRSSPCSAPTPAEGAALAQAILEDLQVRGALVRATTPLEPLKAFASTHAGARNASVEFDGERLPPTFRLLYARPGQSYALTIAARLGLPDRLIDRAHSHRSTQAKNLQELLARLDQAARQREVGRA